MPKPQVWGPPLWRKLHEITFDYPVNPTDEQKRDMINFFKNKVPTMIPCEECVENYNKKLMYFPIELNVDSKDELTRWLIHIHNQVNILTGKPIMPVKEAIALYERDSNISNKVIMLLVILLVFAILICRS